MPIGGESRINNPCLGCGGSGEVNGKFHIPCFGTGITQGGGALPIFLKEFYDDSMNKLNDIKQKVDEIKVVVDELNQP